MKTLSKPMSRSALGLLALIPFLALSACETQGGPPPPPPGYGQVHRPPPPGSATHYDARDFAWSAETGGNAINGRVAYRTKTVSAFTCAGGSVVLTPETPYSSARTMRLYQSVQHAVTTGDAVRERSAGDGAPPYASFVRSATCDAAGRFGFHDLPDGAWFLVLRAKPVHGDGAAVVIMRRVEARGGTALNLDLH
jgi:hypothetical protein